MATRRVVQYGIYGYRSMLMYCTGTVCTIELYSDKDLWFLTLYTYSTVQYVTSADDSTPEAAPPPAAPPPRR